MSKEIATTILEQLGNGRFLAMTGAKNLCSHGEVSKAGQLGGLSFKIGRGAKDGITHVRIFLMWNDTYTVEFLRIHGVEAKVVNMAEGLYADHLRHIFTERTGFDTSL